MLYVGTGRAEPRLAGDLRLRAARRPGHAGADLGAGRAARRRRVYTGTKIPEWRGSLLVGVLGARHLHRVVFDGDQVRRHEAYVTDHGRLRDVVMGPDGELYVTTSNCDGRGECPAEKDAILRVTR
jgi:glucose/arabinose dehydrogenase